MGTADLYAHGDKLGVKVEMGRLFWESPLAETPPTLFSWRVGVDMKVEDICGI